MVVLLKYWDREHKKMILELVKVKSKTKKQKESLQKLREIPDIIKQAILNKYLVKCKMHNALKFFEWRKKNTITKGLTKDEQIVLNLRVKQLQEQERILFKDTEAFLTKQDKKRDKSITKTESITE